MWREEQRDRPYRAGLENWGRAEAWDDFGSLPGLEALPEPPGTSRLNSSERELFQAYKTPCGGSFWGEEAASRAANRRDLMWQIR